MTDNDDFPEQAIPTTDLRGESESGPEQTLRQRADRIARDTAAQPPEAIAALSPEDLQRTFHELRVYQIELEMQNEELRRAQAQIEHARARYFDLYELAPIGYCTLSQPELIREANLTAARLLGLTRSALTGQPLSRFIIREDRVAFYLFRKSLFEAPLAARPGPEQDRSEPVRTPRVCTLRIAKPDGAIIWVRLEAATATDADGSPVCRIAISDISSSKQAELDALNALMTAVPGVVYQFRVLPDGAWRFPYLSPGIATLYGVPVEAAYANPDALTLCILPNDRPSHRAAVERANQTLTPWFHEHRIHPSGQPDQLKWVRGQATPCLQPDGSVLWNGILMDITEHKLAEEALRRNQTMLARAEAITHVGSWEWEVATDTVTWSDELYRILQRDPAAGAPSFADHAQVYIAEDMQRLRDAVAAALTQGTPYELDLRAIRKDGATVVVLAVGHAEIGTDKQVTRLFGFIQDVTERRAAERALHESEQRYRALFDHISSGVAIYEIRDSGKDVVFRDFNHAAERLSGVQRKDLVGKSPAEVFPGVGALELLEVLRQVGSTGIAQHVPVKLYHDERLTRWYDNYVYRLPTGEVVAVFDDVTALKEHDRQLEYLAHSDALTALPNRTLLYDRLRHAMAQTQRRGQYLAVVYLDLDGFKAINDRHGHDAGNQLLIALSRRMKQMLRESDTLARLGGDEFVAVLVDLGDRAAGVPLLNRLLAAAAAPVPLGDVVMQVSASLGVTFYPQPVPGEREGTDALDADQLLRQADQAMYLAKQAGKNRYHVFNVEQDHRTRGEQESLERIRRALVAREFVLYYQPTVNLRTGAVIGVEALIRWQHPQRGLLLPQEFLPAIEDELLAVELGEWVIETALTQMDSWRASGLDLPVSVNVGARQLRQADFVARLRALLAAHPGVKPSSLALEILETSATQDLTQVARVVADCRTLGVSCALDDFGIGYSSFTCLKHLAVTSLKIDRSFVGHMLDNPDDLAIVESILGLATAFRRQAVAEGVETLAQCERLRQLGCELAQGFRIAHPLPAHELPDWLAAWQPSPHWIDPPLASTDE